MTLLRPGDVVGARYRVLHPIARGGMGAVFEAEDVQLGRRVALKVLLPALLSDGQARERFRREARAVAAVRHEGLVGIHDLALEANPPYLVMELVDGESLRDVLAVHGCLPLSESLSLVADVLDALAALHAAGIVHRDLKPANVLVTQGPAGPRAKLIDLGVAQVEDAGDTLTGTDVAVGTPAYMAPEQLAGQRVGPAADMWAAGVLLHTLLTGARPYAATTLAELVGSTQPPALRPLRDTCPKAPLELDALVGSMLHPQPGERPTDAFAIAGQLRVLAGQAGEASPAPTEASLRSSAPRRAPVGGFGVGQHAAESERTTVGASATPKRVDETPTSAPPGFPASRDSRAIISRVRWWVLGIAALLAAAGFAVFVTSRGPLQRHAAALGAGSTPEGQFPEEERADPAHGPPTPPAPFVYRPPAAHIVVLYGSAEEERSVGHLVEDRVRACFPAADERRLGLITAYSVWFEDGRVTELRDGMGHGNPSLCTAAEDACVRQVLYDTVWPTSGIEPWFGRYRVVISIAAWPPGARAPE